MYFTIYGVFVIVMYFYDFHGVISSSTWCCIIRDTVKTGKFNSDFRNTHIEIKLGHTGFRYEDLFF